jgi:diguanylate cyclase (GGDEF)-like protein
LGQDWATVCVHGCTPKQYCVDLACVDLAVKGTPNMSHAPVHRRQISLRSLFILPLIVQIILAIWLTAWLSLRNGQSAIRDLVEQLRTEMTGRVVQYLNTHLEDPYRANRLIAGAIATQDLDPQDPIDLELHLWEILQQFPSLGNLAYGDAAGRFSAVQYDIDGLPVALEISPRTEGKLYIYYLNGWGRRRGEPTIRQGFDPLDRSWYRETLVVGGPTWNPILTFFSDPNLVVLSAGQPLRDQQGRPVGVLAARMYLSTVSQFLQELNVSNNGLVFVVDRNGQLIASSDPATQPQILRSPQSQARQAILAPNPKIRAAVAAINDQFGSIAQANQVRQFDLVVEGAREFAQIMPYRDARGLDWRIVTLIPEQDVMAQIQENTRFTLVVCGVAIFVATGLGMVLARWLLRPILASVQAADDLSHGHWQRRVPLSRIRELQLLGAAFNRMADRLQVSFVTLDERASHDPLTGLLNREAFQKRLREVMSLHATSLHSSPPGESELLVFNGATPVPAVCQGTEHCPLEWCLEYDQCQRLPQRLTEDGQPLTQLPHQPLFALLFLDLDDFKLVNDSLGHLVGDRLLVSVARRLRQCLRMTDLIARFGGDEFVVLATPLHSVAESEQIAERIAQALRQPFRIDGREIFTNTSIGIAIGGSGSDRPEELIRNADTALYQAKARGKSQYELFDRVMHERAVKRLALETDLRFAIEQQEFSTCYQPILDLRSRRIIGFEVLIRWEHPQRGLISPGEFIPVAEETGAIVPIGWWVLEEACRQLQQWQEQWQVCLTVSVNVNVAGRQLLQPDFVERTLQLLGRYDLMPHCLKLEITEGSILSNTETTRAKLQALTDAGIRLCIDDFGTGYSSLSYLHRFPFDTVKIDQTFVQHLGASSEQDAIVRAIISLSQQLGMTVVAEGVETDDQVQDLLQMGCEFGQGYLFSRPVLPKQAADLLFANVS